MRVAASWCVLAASVAVGVAFGPTRLRAASPLPLSVWQVRPAPPADTTAADPGRVGPGGRPVEYVLEPILVTAERERATAPPVATITVSPAELHTTQSENPYDLIRRVTGLEVHDQGQGPGFASNVVLRGFTADHSSDLLLTVDGVPVNLPVHGHVEGYADWNYLFPGAISSLRVIHGPSSPLHGDFALAGAIEVYTKPDAVGTAGQLSANGFGDVSGWVTTGARGDGGGGLVGVEARRTEGWRDRSGQEIGNALLRGWRSVGSGRIEGGLALYGADWSSPGFLSMSDFASRNLDLVADRTDGGHQARGAAHARYAVPIGRDRYLQVTGWGVTSDWDLWLTVPGHTDAVGSLYQTWESDRRWATGGQAELSWTPRVGELTLGVSGRRDWSQYDQSRALRRVAIEDLVALDAGHASVSGYLRWRWHVLDHLGLDLGARVDHLHNRSMNRLGLERVAIESFPVFADPWPIYTHDIEIGGAVGEWVGGSQTLVSPKLGAVLQISDRWSLMASSSRGFRSAVGVVGDPERPPVVAWGQELGLDFDGGGVEAHVSLFRTDVAHERIQDPITLAITSSGSSVRQGVEAMADVDLGRGVRLFGRGTLTDAVLSGRYADAHDDHDQGHDTADGSDASGQTVPGIARYVGQLSLESPIWRALQGRVEWRVTGPYVPIGEPDVRTDPFFTLDAALGFPIRPGLLLDLEVRNVLDRVYAEMRSSGYVSPGVPRSLSLTLNLLEPNG